MTGLFDFDLVLSYFFFFNLVLFIRFVQRVYCKVLRCFHLLGVQVILKVLLDRLQLVKLLFTLWGFMVIFVLS